MNKAHCFTEMGADIKGIERFYPPAVFHDAHAAGECVIGVSANTGHISISKSQLDGAKAKLLPRLLATTDQLKLVPLKKVIDDIGRAITGELPLG
jgi:hypothetical protein